MGLIHMRKKYDVALQDQTTESIGLRFVEVIQDLTIQSDTTLDSKTVVVSAETEPLDTSLLCFKEGKRFSQIEIVSHTNDGGGIYTLTLDTPLDYAYTTNAFLNETTSNMAVDGSITPRIFRISPKNLNDIKWDVTGISGTVLDQSPMDDSTFGGIPALTNGVVLRYVNNYYKNIANIKSNGHLKLQTDVSYSDKAPAGFYGLNFSKKFTGQENTGVAIRLYSKTEDELQIIIQDNLSDLDNLTCVLRGHIVED